MNTILPTKGYNHNQKRAIVAINYKLYKSAPKKKKKEILDDLEEATKYHRKYLIYLLSMHDRVIAKKGKVQVRADITKSAVIQRGRKPVYPEHLGKILYSLWKKLDFASSVHIKAFIEENFDEIWKFDDLASTPEKDRQLIKQMSRATIERLLKPRREEFYRKLDEESSLPLGKHKRKGFSQLKGEIEIEKWIDKREVKPGYLEIDLVEHNGGNSRGEYLYTLVAVDVKSYWVKLKVLPNKARVWTINAMKEIIAETPFDIYHIHSDNGSEFINDHFYQCCNDLGIKFTRSRRHRSNDNPHVENRNLHVVRKNVGYGRYTGKKTRELIGELYYWLELKYNFFIPTMKVVDKQRIGKRYIRKPETKTPYMRLIEDESIPEAVKERLREMKKELSFKEVEERIEEIKKRLHEHTK